MATRSTINIRIPGVYQKGIYVHWDGSPGTRLPILNNYYNTKEKVLELLKLGDLSSIQENIKPPKGQAHTFENPYSNTTVAYHRDRGEELCFNGNSEEEYNYVFTEKGWIIK